MVGGDVRSIIVSQSPYFLRESAESGENVLLGQIKKRQKHFLTFLIACQQNEDVFVLQSREAKTQNFEQDFFFHPRRQKSMYPKLYLPPVKRSSAACLKGFGGERPLCIIHARTN